MPTAFCPGHITCFFAPGRTDGDLLCRGSRGVGIRTTLGATVELNETSGSKVDVTIDGASSDAPVTRHVLEELLPGRGVEVVVTNGLPVSQGFGMSAAGAVAAALCATEVAGLPEARAWEAAHKAEIIGGGGLGDVSALSLPAHVPVRESEGLPPHGRVTCSCTSFSVLSVAVIGPKMHTGQVLSDPERRRRITDAGESSMRVFNGTRASLFEQSNRFSSVAGVEAPELTSAIRTLHEGHRRAAMCMLGNSLFTDSPVIMVRDALPDADVFSMMSTSEPARVVKK